MREYFKLQFFFLFLHLSASSGMNLMSLGVRKNVEIVFKVLNHKIYIRIAKKQKSKRKKGRIGDK